MKSSVAASIMGHDYQGRIFLAFAAQLRVPTSNTVVYYERPLFDEHYGLVDVDFFQVKYQVRQGGKVTWQALMDPEFINAASVSILERLRDAVADTATSGTRARFTLLSPRPIDDNLRLLLNNAAGAIDIDKLFDGTTARTERGKIRRDWKRHLRLSSEDELRAILAPIRIVQAPSLDRLRYDADVSLREAGLEPWPGDQHANRYDDLPRKLVTGGVTLLDRSSSLTSLHRTT